MSPSKLEAALANDLMLMARRESNPWPEPIREMHPLWCCEHPKRFHKQLKMHWPLPEPHDWYAPYCAHEDCYQPWHSNPRLISKCVEEYRRDRDFRVDFAYPAFKVAIEVDGVVYGGQVGRHQTGAGFARDRNKDAALRLAGWDCIHVTAAQIKDGTALQLIEHALGVTK